MCLRKGMPLVMQPASEKPKNRRLKVQDNPREAELRQQPNAVLGFANQETAEQVSETVKDLRPHQRTEDRDEIKQDRW